MRRETAYLAEHFATLANKKTVVVPFKLNKAQAYLDTQIRKQEIETGMCRVIVLKGRQQGCSKYCNIDLIRRVMLNRNRQGFIMAHDRVTTDSLFLDLKNMHKSLPQAIQIPTAASNAKELSFETIDSRIRVGTAGNAEVGRGTTLGNFHGSEVAFWKNGDKILAGVLQAIPLEDRTSVILESTANGMGNKYYDMCMDAMQGKGDFRLVFLAWWWSDEYEREPAKGWEVDEESQQYFDLYMKPDDIGFETGKRKLYWRHMKIVELGEFKFKQEYPAHVMEAFQTSGDSLINAEHIVAARNNTAKDKHAPLIMGVDPARSGDRTVIAFRRGREVPIYYTYTDMDEMRLVGIIAGFIRQHDPVAVNIDVGCGYGTIDRLQELGYSNIHGIHFGSSAIEDYRYANKRVEMWCEMRDWFAQDGGTNIPDCNEMQMDISIVPDSTTNSSGKEKLVSKDKIKEEYKKSPDIGDALALTFATPVSVGYNAVKVTRKTEATLGDRMKKWDKQDRS